MGCKRQTTIGLLCVLGGVIIQITYGNFYTVGNIAPYMVDYMNYHNMSVKSTSVVWLTSVAISMEAVAMPIGGFLSTKIGFRLVVLLSCLIQSGGIALTYFALSWGFIAVVVTYGAIQGFGFGFGYSVIISTTAMWFPRNRGLVVGLIVGGFGAGALLFTPIQTAFINPNNIAVNNVTKTFTDPDLLARVPKACLVLAATISCIQAFGLLMMRERVKEGKIKSTGKLGSDEKFNEEAEELKNHDAECSAAGDKPTASAVGGFGFDDTESLANWNQQYTPKPQMVKILDIPPREAVRSVDFYLLWFAVCFAVVPITNVSSLYKVAGVKYIHDDLFLAGVAMAASLCNSVGRVVWGCICDRLSFKIPMCLMIIVWTTMLFTFPHISVFSGVSAKIFYTIWVSMLYFCQCGIFVFAPTATEILFGPVNLAVNYGLIYNAFIAGSMFASVMNMIPIPGNRENQAFVISGAMCILSLIIVFFIADKKTPRQCHFINLPLRLRRSFPNWLVAKRPTEANEANKEKPVAA
ncbi:Monocarboxylate transporter 11 [Clonorchis sinensis]|uniref:Monocarboxylate transporter 11 n=1 Tax=Clonorchis sinensis TaxID=79923 RepID=A0A8T1M3Q4_CLOSI|nr:Monocarboxylate transporter 11 [Clonorchis sinensis]